MDDNGILPYIGQQDPAAARVRGRRRRRRRRRCRRRRADHAVPGVSPAGRDHGRSRAVPSPPATPAGAAAPAGSRPRGFLVKIHCMTPYDNGKRARAGTGHARRWSRACGTSRPTARDPRRPRPPRRRPRRARAAAGPGVPDREGLGAPLRQARRRHRSASSSCGPAPARRPRSDSGNAAQRRGCLDLHQLRARPAAGSHAARCPAAGRRSRRADLRGQARRAAGRAGGAPGTPGAAAGTGAPPTTWSIRRPANRSSTTGTCSWWPPSCSTRKRPSRPRRRRPGGPPAAPARAAARRPGRAGRGSAGAPAPRGPPPGPPAPGLAGVGRPSPVPAGVRRLARVRNAGLDAAPAQRTRRRRRVPNSGSQTHNGRRTTEPLDLTDRPLTGTRGPPTRSHQWKSSRKT